VLRSLAKREPVVAVLWLYGSQAKGTAQSNSDYDLAVAFRSFPDDAWECRLQPELLAQRWAEQLDLPEDKISVVDINHIPIQLAFSIMQTGNVLQVNDFLRLAREENRISSMWELDHLYHRKHYG
jgi:predicted nucleotidyltransferase